MPASAAADGMHGAAVRGWIVNDYRSMIPGSVTLWDHLLDWLPGAEWVGGMPFSALPTHLEDAGPLPDYVIRNASYFPWVDFGRTPVVALMQDIFPVEYLTGVTKSATLGLALRNRARERQIEVCRKARMVVFNSEFTRAQYPELEAAAYRIIPLPVDFDLFRPMPEVKKEWDVCWIGAATQVKGWDILQRLIAETPHSFTLVMKDETTVGSDRVRCFNRLSQDRLVEVINSCRVGLCTSRLETQHLAGIEMGACGLFMVAPNVGAYWHPYARTRQPEWGYAVEADAPESFGEGIRQRLDIAARSEHELSARAYWLSIASMDACRAAWLAVVEEVTRG